jgi:hypothetical protein
MLMSNNKFTIKSVPQLGLPKHRTELYVMFLISNKLYVMNTISHSSKKSLNMTPFLILTVFV